MEAHLRPWLRDLLLEWIQNDPRGEEYRDLDWSKEYDLARNGDPNDTQTALKKTRRSQKAERPEGRSALVLMKVFIYKPYDFTRRLYAPRSRAFLNQSPSGKKVGRYTRNF